MINKNYLFPLLLSLMWIAPLSSQSSSNQIPLLDDEYNIEIISSQWNFLGIDLNSVQQLEDGGTHETEARELSSSNTSLGLFKPGKVINFILFSIDVQHGFSLVSHSAENQTVVKQEAFIRPFPNDGSKGDPVEVSVLIPEDSEKLSIECHIFCGLGHPNMRFDLYMMNTSTSVTLDISNGLIIIAALTGISILGFSIMNIRSKLLLTKPEISQQQEEIISELFQKRTSLYFYVFNQTNKGELNEGSEHKIIPQDLFNHKFLLHPVRMSIMKLLYEHMNLTSNEIKELLNISWNDIGNHLNALKEKGYVALEHKVVESGRKLVASIEPKGLEQFKMLIDILHVFLDTTVDFEISDLEL